MYAIETDLGRFEADTEKDAKKLLREAKIKQDKLDAIENEMHVMARHLACRSAYWIYSHRGEKDGYPSGWRLKPVTESSYPCRLIFDAEAGLRTFLVETSDDSATIRPYDRITHCVESGAGYCIAIAIENQDCELFAVGIHEGRICWLPLFGVAMSEFTKG